MILYSLWRSISLPTRIQIANELGIKKHGPTHVRDNVVESDGYLLNEVEAALNVDKLQAHLGSDERDEATLIKMLVDRIEGNVDTTSNIGLPGLNGVPGENLPPLSKEAKEKIMEIVEDAAPSKRRGRPKKPDVEAS